MKKSSLLMLLVLPLLLVGCGRKSDKQPKGPFEVPLVDLDKLSINLPNMPTWDTTSPVKNDGEYDIIDIYEVSDMHGMINYKTGTDGYWGFSGMANFFNEKRSENKGTIVVSSGDMWQGGCESNLTRGKVVAECMRYVGFEAMALGNHEFDWGEDVLQHNSTYYTADMPLLCGNLVDKRTNQRPTYIGTSRVIERGGYKIGVVGAIGDSCDDSIAKAAFENFKLTRSADFASLEAKTLRDNGCDIVIYITHDDVTEATVPDYVDAIFGGHSHQNKGGDSTSTSSSTVDHSIPRVQTKNYGDAIGHVQFKIDSSKHIVDATGEYLRAEANQAYLKDEPNIKSIISQYEEATNVVKNYKLNTVSGDFEAEDQLANLSCRAIYETYKDASTFGALQNGKGGVRSDVKSGTVTYGDIYTAFPFDNELVYFTITGSKIRDLFESAAAKGLQKYVTITRYDDIEASKEYKIVTTDFVCTNKLDMKENEFTRFSGTVIRDCVAKYIYDTKGLKSENFSSENANYKNPSKY